MTKLSRKGNIYHGTYKGHEFTVGKETVDTRYGNETVWMARSGTFMHQSSGRHGSRFIAVDGLLRQLDMAALDVPEIDAVLKRWAEAIKTVTLHLDPKDINACLQLEALSMDLTYFDKKMRDETLRFEEKLAKLRARIQHPEEHTATPTIEPMASRGRA